MRRDAPLSLPEEILLLALHDEKGTIAVESKYAYAVGGAALAELAMRGRIRLEGSGKKTTVSIESSRPTGEPFLDECLAKIDRDAKTRTAQVWVTKFAATKQLRHRLAEQLVDRGILGSDENKILLLFTRRIYPEVDPRPERKLLERLRRAIFSSDEVDPRTAVLVSLAHQAGLLPNAFDKKELKERKGRIEQIGKGEATSQAAKEAIKAMEAAFLVAVIVPTIVTN